MLNKHKVKHSKTNKLNADQSYLVVIEKLITAIGQETSKKRVLGAILPYALTVSGTEVGALLVADDSANSFLPFAKHGLSPEIIKQLSTGDLSNLLLMGQCLWMKPQPTQQSSGKTVLGRQQLKYLFGMPLRYAGQVLGAIIVGSRSKEYHSLQPLQQQRLTVMAHLVALFLDDIRLRTQPIKNKDNKQIAAHKFNRDTELEQLLAAVMSAEEEVATQNLELGLLDELTTQVGSTLQLKTIIDTAIKQTQVMLGADAGCCYLLHDDVLDLAGHNDLSEDYVENMSQILPGNGGEGMAFSRQEPILRDALLFHSGQMRRQVQQEGLVSIAAVPLLANNMPFGVLAVATRSSRSWTARDRRVLVSIGRRVEQAIYNAKMFKAAKEKASTMETSFTVLQQSNIHLARRAEELENQIDLLRRAEQQIWSALAASQRSKRNGLSKGVVDEDLIATLTKALGAPKNEQNNRTPAKR